MEICMEDISEEQKTDSSGQSRKAEDILVRLKQNGEIIEIPLLMLLAGLFDDIADIKLRLSLIEVETTKKSPLIRV